MKSEGRRRIFISTGEVSGDLQGAMLVEALHRQANSIDLDLEIVALGGERMAAAGATLLGNTSGIGSIGLVESLPFLVPTLRLQQRVRRELQQHPPDLVVFIDYLGPNLGIGQFVRQQLPTVPTVYYITPQEWVWSVNPRNTQRIIELSDRLLAIFPGEASYYQKCGASVTWVGHPLVDWVQTAPTRKQARSQLNIPPEQTAIALLPASRRQELKYLLPVIFETAKRLQAKIPQIHFWIPLSLEALRSPIEQAIREFGLQATIVADSRSVIAAADFAIAKSGTANLEIALMNVPQIVLYRVNSVTAWIARKILKFSIPFASPPNLLLMEAIVPEFLQEDATAEHLTNCAIELLQNLDRRQQMLADYARMQKAAGEVGVCDRAAQEILKLVK
ncbi:lipid-A-disaccharide synthase [Microcoleus sp. FACHB-1515]|uniref:lipid-A-disaccharide synthase n=1 Tax=Cyanophyceae TaxID=3028117 RepID=UPI001686213D|nr:lipid-A-disaccharide synthase [Microcoleus sp. FACHB-1515]MBD2091725.1 lipid-A-disaccharide synthase [Microcoleus sp. FACHB-1515]